MASPHDRRDRNDPQDPYRLLEQCLSADRPGLYRDLRRLPKDVRSVMTFHLAGGPLLATRRCTRRSVRVRLPGLLPPALELSPASTESRSRYCCGIPQA